VSDGASLPTPPPFSNPSSISETESIGADLSAGAPSGSAEQVAADTPFIPVSSKAAQRQARYEKHLSERRAKYSRLYESGLNDREVREILEQARAEARPKRPEHQRPKPADGDASRKRPLPIATPTGLTPLQKRAAAEGSSPASFAEVARGRQHGQAKAPSKTKDSAPFMLEVYSGVNRREAVAQEAFPQFQKLLMAQVFVNLRKPKEEKIPLRIAFTQWSPTKKAFLIACQDDVSQAWCRAQVDGIIFPDGSRFRAWDPIVNRFRAVRVTVGDMAVTPAEALELVLGCNGEHIMGEITLLKNTLVPSRRGGLQVLLGFDDLAAAWLFLKEDPLRLSLGLNLRSAPYAGLSSLIVRLYNEGHCDVAGNLVQKSNDPTIAAAYAAAEGEGDLDQVDEEGSEGSGPPTSTPAEAV
jgi:hypothetical protein